MRLTQDQIDFINRNERATFATCSKNGKPRAAVVIPSRVEPARIIISNVQMKKSEQNVRENAQVFVLSNDGDTQIKISGTAVCMDSGELFQDIREFEKSRDADVRGIIDIAIESIEQTQG